MYVTGQQLRKEILNCLELLFTASSILLIRIDDMANKIISIKYVEPEVIY